MYLPLKTPKTSAVYDGISKLRVNFSQITYSFDRSTIHESFFGALHPQALQMIDQIENECNNFMELKAIRKLVYLLFLLPVISLVFTFVFVILGISHRHFKYVMYLGIGVCVCMIIFIIGGLLCCIRGRTKKVNKKYESSIIAILNEFNSNTFKNNNITAKFHRETQVTAYSRRRTLGTTKTFYIGFEKIGNGKADRNSSYLPPVIEKPIALK